MYKGYIIQYCETYTALAFSVSKDVIEKYKLLTQQNKAKSLRQALSRSQDEPQKISKLPNCLYRTLFGPILLFGFREKI